MSDSNSDNQPAQNQLHGVATKKTAVSYLQQAVRQSDNQPAQNQLHLLQQRKLLCPICNRQYANWSAFHSHLSRTHRLDEKSRRAIVNRLVSQIYSHPHSDTSATGAGTSQHQTPNEGSEEPSVTIGSWSETDQPIWTVGPASQEENMGTAQIRTAVSDQVYDFYESYGDESEPLFLDPILLRPPFSTLHPTCKTLLSNCLKRTLTGGAAAEEWDLLVSMESHLPQPHRHVSNTFKSASSFTSYLERMKQQAVQKEGWRKAIIHMDSGRNETGVFRPACKLLVDEIKKAGGPTNLQQYQENLKNGVRVYSSPWDSNCFKSYREQLDSEGREASSIAAIDLYSDGTQLARSGSQSANNLRIRFGNIRGVCNSWFEVGIAPWLMPAEDESIRTKEQARRERLELFQHFQFLALKDLIKASRDGIIIDGVLVITRLFMLVVDQVQERQSQCLNAADSFCDCTHCEMPSRNKRKRTGNPLPGRASKRQKTSNGTVSDDESVLSTVSIGSDLSAETMATATSQDATERQLYPSNAESMDVSRTVIARLAVAKSKISEPRMRLTSQERDSLARFRLYLQQVSAKAYPPALAAFYGLGTAPFKLYECCAFDKLHVVDLGLLRMIPDHAFHRYEDGTRSRLPVSQTMQIANQRVFDMPRSAKLPRTVLFRTGKNELQSGMTGLVRREFAPFLWIFLLGLDRSVPPDEDELFQAFLAVSSIHASLIGVNQPADAKARSEEDINKLQKLCFLGCKMLVRSLNVRVNTKIHRTMRHVGKHLHNFGCIRKGSTDDNEVLHKTTKNAYTATNRKLDALAGQLLNARTTICVKQGHISALPVDQSATFETLVSRDPILSDFRNSGEQEISRLSVQHHLPDPQLNEVQDSPTMSAQQQDAYFRSIRGFVERQDSPENAESAIGSERSDSTNLYTWIKKKSYQFRAVLPWARDLAVRQTVYAGDSVFNTKNRRDAVRYKLNNQRPRTGFIQALFEHKSTKKVYALIRRLERVGPENGNRKIVEVYNHHRYKYAHSASGHMITDFVPASGIIRLVIIVPDMYSVTKRLGIKQRMSRIPESAEERRETRFYAVPYYKFTSFAEQLC